MKKLLLFIFLFLNLVVSAQTRIENTNFYVDAGDKIYFQKTYNTELDIANLQFDTLVVVNDTLYVGQLTATIDHKKYKLKKMTAPLHFRYPMFVEVTLDNAQGEYEVIATDIYWYVKGIGELTIEELFFDRQKLINQKYLNALDSWFIDLFN